jgi:predicted Zn-dependent peptidase
VDTVRLDRDVRRTIAPNGVTVLTEHVAGVRSVAVGVWVRTASAHEARTQMGISHLLEHMVFKGTERRSAREIALALESRGGALDAYTSRDTTAFQARVLDRDLPRAIDVLTDVVRRPVLRESDLEPERNVILEEINTVLDTPDDLVFDLSAEALWPEHPYGYTILGTRESVAAMSAADVRERHRAAYVPANCVVAAAGNLEHNALLDLLAHEGWFDAAGPGTPPPLATVPAAVRGVEVRHARDSAQVHLVFATDTIPFADPRRYAVMVVSSVLGGGMSSRLFQRVREELGLAYSVFSFTSFLQGTGLTGVYVGTQPRTAPRAVDAIKAELARLAHEGLRGAELAEAKEQTQGQLMLGLESPTARMYRLASCAIYDDPYRSLDEMLARVAGLSEEDVAAAAAEYFTPDRQTLVWLGPTPA